MRRFHNDGMNLRVTCGVQSCILTS